MSPNYTPEYVLPILERAIAERNDERGIGGAARVASELETSDSLICQIRKNTYPRSGLQKWYRKIVEEYGTDTVLCPGLDEPIALGQCAMYRKRPFASINPEWRRMYQACRACDHNQVKTSSKED